MSRKLFVAALAAVGMMGATAQTAQADPLLPGCYGVGTAVVCDVTAGAETYQTTVPVCAGTCRDVEVTLVRTTDGTCISYEERNGEVHRSCALRSTSQSDWWGSSSSTCSTVDALDRHQSLCVWSYSDYQTGQSESCIGVYGEVDRNLYCY